MEQDKNTLGIALLTQRVEMMHSDFSAMQGVLEKLTDAINGLALVEQRQSQFSEALERAFRLMEKLETRIAALESKAPDITRTSVWVDRLVVGVLVVVAMFVAKKVGLS